MKKRRMNNIKEKRGMNKVKEKKRNEVKEKRGMK